MCVIHLLILCLKLIKIQKKHWRSHILDFSLFLLPTFTVGILVVIGQLAVLSETEIKGEGRGRGEIRKFERDRWRMYGKRKSLYVTG